MKRMSRSGPIINWIRFGIKQQKSVSFPEVEEEVPGKFQLAATLPQSVRKNGERKFRKEKGKGTIDTTPNRSCHAYGQ